MGVVFYLGARWPKSKTPDVGMCTGFGYGKISREIKQRRKIILKSQDKGRTNNLKAEFEAAINPTMSKQVLLFQPYL